ncbi:hypothetical protein Tco_0743056 [Tanacetum coccineum]
MGRDTIQLDDAVSTISGEYLLEFTSEYGIPEDLHPELPGPEDTIVDFPEGKVGAPKDGMPPADSYSALDVTTLNTCRTPIKKQPELLLCLVGLSRRYFLGDDVDGLVQLDQCPESCQGEDRDSTPPPLENPPTTEVVLEPNLKQEAAAIGPLVYKRRRKRGNDESDANAPPKVLRKDHVAFRPTQSTIRGKSLATMGKAASSTITPATQDTPAGASSVKDLDPLSYAEPRPIPEQDIAQSSKKTVVAKDPDSERSTSFTSMGGSPGSIYQPGWGVTSSCRLDTPNVCQDIEAKEKQIKNIEALLEAEADMKKAAEAKNAELMKELEGLRGHFSDLQLSNQQLSQQVSTLQAQITGEEKIKAAFEEFKKYEDDRVEQRCAEMDARLDKLSVDFDEELYPHMLTAIAGRRWVIGHGLRLAVMKCGETPELRQAFANVVSAGLVKGMSEGLEHGIEHGKAGRDLEAVEAYDPEAHSKYLKALQELKDLKYPLVDQLEGLKDAPMELIMASLHLESDSGEDAPQWIRDLRPSISQLKIPVYPEVRDPRDPWAIKEEILLEDAIAANVSRAEKKKKCRVVCRTHGVGSAHHARSDGVPVSAPTVAPQGLAILLADASTQTEISKGEASPRLLRSMSLPAMYNLDWP